MIYENLAVVVQVPQTRQNLVMHHVAVLQRTAKKCTKIYNAHAQLLFCSLNLSLGDLFVAVVVVVSLLLYVEVTAIQLKRGLTL